MKGFIVIFIIVILFCIVTFAQENTCDYEVKILIEDDEFKPENFTWRMRATKVDGPPTNITGTTEIEDAYGKIIKTYKPWASEPISRQKTSSEYSPDLKPGKYKIVAEISVGCNDINEGNDIDEKDIKITEYEAKKERSSKTSSASSNEEQYKIVQSKNEKTIAASSVIQEQRVIYESSDEKAKDLIIIFILILSVLLNIILVWKR
ncbi:hypothetical protein HYW99_02370 [Candidatus Woesearchaeota archaeon]|nr:hypothetical protein [Candidatus Woesearchaeota archaeon]